MSEVGQQQPQQQQQTAASDAAHASVANGSPIQLDGNTVGVSQDPSTSPELPTRPSSPPRPRSSISHLLSEPTDEDKPQSASMEHQAPPLASSEQQQQQPDPQSSGPIASIPPSSTAPSASTPQARRVYVANLVISLPALRDGANTTTTSQVNLHLRLPEPDPSSQPVEDSTSSAPVLEIPLQEHDITFIDPPRSNGHHSLAPSQLSPHNGPFHSRNLSTASSIASASAAAHPQPPPLTQPPASSAAPLVAGQAVPLSTSAHNTDTNTTTTTTGSSGFLPSRLEPTPSTIAAATLSTQTPLHDIPTERLVPPSIRPPEAESLVKTKITLALRDSRQWAGSRPAPLTQVDRFLNRIDLFVKLHNATQYTADASAGERQEEMPIVYWADLLKFGGLGSTTIVLTLKHLATVQAWNEKKGRRAYKVIYSDLREHKEHPVIRSFLEHERWKTMDDLEAAFDDLYGRKKQPMPLESPVAMATLANAAQLPPLPSTSASAQTAAAPSSVASDVPEDDALLDLAETGRAAPMTTPSGFVPSNQTTPASSAVLPSAAPPPSRKRKLDAMELEPIPELLPIPTERLVPPSTREDDSAVRSGIVEDLIKAGQWSGSRPVVISSLASLIHRVMLLIRIHAAETTGPDNQVVYWHDCVRFGGVAQAWNSRKANRQAFKKTYADLVRFQSHPMVQQLFASPATTDIKTAEVVLAALSSGSAPPSTSPAPSTRPSSPPATSKRRFTPEWSESPPDLNGMVVDEEPSRDMSPRPLLQQEAVAAAAPQPAAMSRPPSAVAQDQSQAASGSDVDELEDDL